MNPSQSTTPATNTDAPAPAFGRSVRERILATASRLFLLQGIRAVGVDDIIREAGVAKASFYKWYPSKDDVVVAFLKRRDAAWRDWLARTVSRLSPEPDGRPLAIFDALEERFTHQDFRGCSFLNCLFELPDRSHAGHITADEHKREVIAYVEEVLVLAGIQEPAALARDFMILIDGAIATAVREGGPNAAQAAKRMASVLLRDRFESAERSERAGPRDRPASRGGAR